MLSPDLPRIRHALDRRADALEQEIIAKQAGLRAPPAEVGDRKDDADALAAGAVAAAEIERDLAELREIAAARARITEGRYGLCVDCDEAIAESRLIAQPTALRCLACQDAREHGAALP